MHFELIFKFLIENLSREKINFALMEGFALQAVGITRTTCDIDLLILSEASPKIKNLIFCVSLFNRDKELDDIIKENKDAD